jgi:two-component system chemotaxis response regulator CheB
MPPVFTEKLAEMLTKLSPGYTVKEAKPGDVLEAGVCYLAPGDYHMVMLGDNTLSLNQKEKVCYVRPAANCLFESVASHFKEQILSVVLTGMGDDGAEGVKKLSEVGCYTFYQDEASCTVFGMPAAVKRTGLGKEIQLGHVAELINNVNARL